MSRWTALTVLILGCTRTPVPRDGLPDPGFTGDRPDVEVVVTDPDGQPIAGAWVTLAPTGRDAIADTDGAARLPGVGSGTFDVHVAAGGYGAVTLPIEVGAGDASFAVGLLPLEAGARMVGSITDPYGAPVADVIVEIDGVAVTSTGPDGRYEARGLTPGPRAVRFVPSGARLDDWTIPEVALVDAGVVAVDAALAGRATDRATYVGSEACLFCHGGRSAPGGKWFGSAHATASQDPTAWVGTDLGEAFADGAVIDLAPLVPGATVTLDEDTPGDWTAVISDGAASTDPLPVSVVYGGHRTGAVLAVDSGGTLSILPAVWALAGQGLSSQQDPAGFLPAYTTGWFTSGGALRASPTADASFDLQCAGCHATGHALAGSGAVWNLEPITPRGALERRVGCEACHGPGSEHAARPDLARLTIRQPGRLPPSEKLEACASCHERVEADDHPFALPPQRWAAVPASRVFGDQVGDLRTSPHRGGPGGYDGACEDCHDPHGSDYPASLRRDPWDNGLCTTCHASRFPSTAAERAHASHSVFAPGPWGPGSCTGCHMPRSGASVRPDAVSTVGETHAHGLLPFDPSDTLAEFDLAGVDHLAPGEVAVGGCLDCHLQVDAERRDTGGSCACALGDPGYRVTYENLDALVESLWGTP